MQYLDMFISLEIYAEQWGSQEKEIRLVQVLSLWPLALGLLAL